MIDKVRKDGQNNQQVPNTRSINEFKLQWDCKDDASDKNIYIVHQMHDRKIDFHHMKGQVSDMEEMLKIIAWWPYC